MPSTEVKARVCESRATEEAGRSHSRLRSYCGVRWSIRDPTCMRNDQVRLGQRLTDRNGGVLVDASEVSRQGDHHRSLAAPRTQQVGPGLGDDVAKGAEAACIRHQDANRA
jgi:hypothetical protein